MCAVDVPAAGKADGAGVSRGQATDMSNACGLSSEGFITPLVWTNLNFETLSLLSRAEREYIAGQASARVGEMLYCTCVFYTRTGRCSNGGRYVALTCLMCTGCGYSTPVEVEKMVRTRLI